MRIFAMISALLLISTTSYAQSYGVFGGLNSTVYDDDSTDFERDFGLELGFTALLPIQSGFLFRTGAGFVGRNSSAGGTEVGLTYLEFPATVMLVASPSVRIFGGLNFNLLISDHCETSGGGACTNDTDSIMISLPLGARLRIQGPHFIEPYIEFGMTDSFRNVKVGNVLAARYVYMF